MSVPHRSPTQFLIKISHYISRWEKQKCGQGCLRKKFSSLQTYTIPYSGWRQRHLCSLKFHNVLTAFGYPCNSHDNNKNQWTQNLTKIVVTKRFAPLTVIVKDYILVSPLYFVRMSKLRKSSTAHAQYKSNNISATKFSVIFKIIFHADFCY